MARWSAAFSTARDLWAACAGKGVIRAANRRFWLGQGGVAVAIAYALLDAGIERLVIANRTVERAQRLVERLRTLYPARPIDVGPPDAAGFGLVVNGTALGMHADDPLPLDAETIAPGTIVAEVVMAPPVTPLLEAARQRGADIHEGAHMLIGQIDPFIDFVLGSDAAASGSPSIQE